MPTFHYPDTIQPQATTPIDPEPDPDDPEPTPDDDPAPAKARKPRAKK